MPSIGDNPPGFTTVKTIENIKINLIEIIK
jgi:hypothetical protein